MCIARGKSDWQSCSSDVQERLSPPSARAGAAIPIIVIPGNRRKSSLWEDVPEVYGSEATHLVLITDGLLRRLLQRVQ